MTRPRTVLAVLVTLLLLLLTACGDDDEPTVTGSSTTTEAPSSSSSTTTTTGDENSEDPIGTPGDRPTEGLGDGSGQIGLLAHVRLAVHDGFDRIVFEFEDHAPNYRIEYVDPPITEDASGETVDVAGNAFLQIRMEPASGFDTSGEGRQTYSGDTRLDGAGTPVEELVRTGDFEAVLTWVAGVDGEHEFAAGTLSDPPRLVVDVLSD